MGMKRRAAIVMACGALLSGTACSAQVSDEQRFVADMIQRIKQRLPGAEIVQQDDPLSISVKASGRAETTLNFGSVYRWCRQASAEECATMRSEFLDTVLRTPAAATATSLRIAVRDAEYVRHVPKIVAEPIGEDLFAVLLSDASDGFATVPLDTLAGLGLTREQAWARAWQQTKAVLPALPSPAALAQGAVLYEGQDYFASLLADTRAWGAIAHVAGPELFVTVVADHLVFVGRMPEGPKLEQFKQTVRGDCEAQPRGTRPMSIASGANDGWFRASAA
jgi:hypothetical protein